MFEGFEGFRKGREACRKNFHLISCNMDSVVTSYGQKTNSSKKYKSIKVPGNIRESSGKFPGNSPDIPRKQLGLPEVHVGPERFKKFREACRNNFHLISCNMDSVVTSYDQKTKKALTIIKLTSIKL